MFRRSSRIAHLPLAGTLTLAFLLAGCGGGGGSSGGGPVSAPPPVATAPAPAPAPPPAPTSGAAPAPSPTPSPSPAATVNSGGAPQILPVSAAFDTREFRQSDGPGEHNAATAWQAGHSGKGVTIAVVDSGIDLASPEFAGRIAAASRDIYASRGTLAGSHDHGTRVAQVAAGARDDYGVLGMAWNATILALRTDQPGSCSGSTTGQSGCLFSDSAIAEAVTYAADNGAKVVNISLGGGSASSVLAEAVRAATARGVLVVVSAGNEGLDAATDFTTRLAAAGGSGVLVVGSTDESGRMSDFSNRAGANTAGYLAARGEAVCCTYQDGQLYTDANGYLRAFSGTSFAAPQVSGAAALLAQAFPHLTGQQLAAILLESAFDAGVAGPDAVYGSGILDLARAFRPLGATALAGGTVPLALGGATGTGSGAMGDAIASVSLPALVTDKFARAFSADLGAGLRAAPIARPLAAASVQTRDVVLGVPQASLALSFAGPGSRATTSPDGPAMAIARGEAEALELLGAQAALALSPQTQIGFAYRQTGEHLAAQLRGRAQPAFLIARHAGRGAESMPVGELALALRHGLGGWGLTVSGEAGAVRDGAMRGRDRFAPQFQPEAPTRRFGLALDRDFGPLETTLGLSWLAEERSLLGARFHDALGLAGADSLLLDAEAAWHFAPRWRLGAAMRRGTTSARAGGLVEAETRLASGAWSFDLSKAGVLAPADTLAIRLSQPLRVSGGALTLRLPSGWSYDTLTASHTTHRLPLTPQGRELTAELAWSGPLLAGRAAASLFYRHEPGHYPEMPADAGLALSWSRGF